MFRKRYKKDPDPTIGRGTVVPLVHGLSEALGPDYCILFYALTEKREARVAAVANGARDGFLFAIGLIPAVMLALGIVEVVDHLGGLRAGQRMLTPILRPMMGIPGVAGLALVTSLQSTDAGGGMTRMLREENFLTEGEKTIFCAFQFSAGGTITNYLSSGAALFAFMTVPIIVPLALMFVLKVFGANVMRLYLRHVVKEA